MTEEKAPNVALDLLRIHAIVTRGLTIATEKSGVFAQEGFPDPTATRSVTALEVRHATVGYPDAMSNKLHTAGTENRGDSLSCHWSPPASSSFRWRWSF